MTADLHFKIVSIQMPAVGKLFCRNSIHMFENRDWQSE